MQIRQLGHGLQFKQETLLHDHVGPKRRPKIVAAIHKRNIHLHLDVKAQFAQLEGQPLSYADSNNPGPSVRCTVIAAPITRLHNASEQSMSAGSGIYVIP